MHYTKKEQERPVKGLNYGFLYLISPKTLYTVCVLGVYSRV